MEQTIEITFRSLAELRDELNKREDSELNSTVLNDDQGTVVLVVERSRRTGDVSFETMAD